MRIVFIVSNDNIFGEIQHHLQASVLSDLELHRFQELQQALLYANNTKANLLLISDEIIANHTTINLNTDIPTLLIGKADTIHRIMQQASSSGIDDFLFIEQLTAPLLEHRIKQLMQYKVTQKFSTITNAIQKTIHSVNTDIELQELLSIITDGLQAVIEFDGCNFMLLDGVQAQIVHFYGYANPIEDLQMAVYISNRPELQHIINTRTPLVIEDTSTYPGWSAKSERASWISAYIGIPLMLNGQVLGFINLENRTALNITDDQLDWLTVFANQTINVLHNARIKHEHQKQQDEVTMLRQLIDLVTSTVNLDRLIKTLLDYLHEVISYDVINIFLVEDNEVEIVATLGDAQPEQMVGVRFKADRYLILRELERRQRPIVSSNIKTDPLFKDWHIPNQKRSWMGVPLFAHGLCIGYMTMESERIAAYDKEQAALLHTFANQAAIAIHNAQLYEEIRRYTVELEERVERRTAELHSANEELKRSERQYRALFEATFEGVSVYEEDKLIDANSAFSELFQYSPAELIGQSILKLFTDEERARVKEKLTSRKNNPLETIGIKKNGKRFPIEILIGEYEHDGRIVRMIAVRDISERKKLEKQQLEMERVRILADFIAKSSHEFRTPLSIIGTSAYLLKRRAKTDKEIHHIEVIEIQMRYITRLVDNMIILSKLDHGEQAFDFAPIKIALLIDECYGSMQDIAKEKQITLSKQNTESDVYVDGDMSFLFQAVRLVCDNAIQYTKEGGKVVISTLTDNDHVIIRIEDNGIGISAENLPHIFDRFYRVDEAATSRGFGLGLSISRSIINSHQGKIEVQSQPDKGTIVEIYLPIATIPSN